MGLGALAEDTGLAQSRRRYLQRSLNQLAGAVLQLLELEVERSRSLVALGVWTSDGFPTRGEDALRGATDALEAGDLLAAVRAVEDGLRELRPASGTQPPVGDPPLIEIESPRAGAVLLDAEECSVAGMVTDRVLGVVDSADVTVAVNGRQASVVNGSFFLDGLRLRPGRQFIVAVAIDRDGNTADWVTEVEVREQEGTSPTGHSASSDPGPSTVGGDLERTWNDAAGAQPDSTASCTCGLYLVGGDDQTAVVGTLLPLPLVTQVRGPASQPVPGIDVVFRVEEGDGLLGNGERAEVVTSDSSGYAATTLTLGKRSGQGVHRVRAAIPLAPGEVAFVEHATPRPAQRVVTSGGVNQRGGVSAQLSVPLTVTALDEWANVVGGVDVWFETVGGGGTVNGSPSTVVTTDLDGQASVLFTLGPTVGHDIHRVEVSLAGGTERPVTFKASAFTLGDPAVTRVSGVVLSGQNEPVPNVTMSLRDTGLSDITDADGQFLISGAPVGHLHLIADASLADPPGTWTSLEFELETLPGINNALERPIYILQVDWDNAKWANETAEVLVEVPGRPGLDLLVPAGSATFSDGSREGWVSVTAVNADRVPMAPGNGMQPRLIIAIQPPGTTFDPPARLRLPNVDAHRPGSVLEMFSFDHDLGAFVSIGPGTVAENALTVTSNPGFGVTKAGWHCAAQPTPDGDCQVLELQCSGSSVAPLCVGDTRVLGAQAEPDDDISYTWSIADESVATLTPSGSGLCTNSADCPTTLTALTPGRTNAKVRVESTTTGAFEECTIPIEVAPGRFLDADKASRDGDGDSDNYYLRDTNPIVSFYYTLQAGLDVQEARLEIRDAAGGLVHEDVKTAVSTGGTNVWSWDAGAAYPSTDTLTARIFVDFGSEVGVELCTSVDLVDLVYRHRPVLHSHQDFERFRPISVERFLELSTLVPPTGPVIPQPTIADLLAHNSTSSYLELTDEGHRTAPPSESGPVTYYHYASEASVGLEDYVFVQYWLLLLDSYGPPSCATPQGAEGHVHEGDWEMMQVTLRKDRSLEDTWSALLVHSVTLSQHYYGQTLKWEEQNDRMTPNHVDYDHDYPARSGDRPHVLMASNAHALYVEEDLLRLINRTVGQPGGGNYAVSTESGEMEDLQHHKPCEFLDLARDYVTIAENPLGEPELRSLHVSPGAEANTWLGKWGESGIEDWDGPESPSRREGGGIQMQGEPVPFHDRYLKVDHDEQTAIRIQ